jgi:hypothetical protein
LLRELGLHHEGIEEEAHEERFEKVPGGLETAAP